MSEALQARIDELEAELKKIIPRHDWARSSMAIKLPPGPGTRGNVQIHAPSHGLEAFCLQLHSDWLARHAGARVVCTSVRYDFLQLVDSALIPCDGTRLVWTGREMHPSVPIVVEFENRSDVATEAWATLYMRYVERRP